jgi:autotransporter-associated beta strand protein
VRVSADNNLGTAPDTATASMLVLSNTTSNLSSFVATETFTLNANRGLTLVGSPSGGQSSYFFAIAADKTLTYNGVIAGSGNLVQNQAGTLVLGGNSSSYSGGIFIDAGTVEFSGGSLGSGSTIGLGANNSAIDAALRFSAANLTTSRNIEVRPGSGARLVSYSPASGSSILGGNIALDNSLAFNVASGGTLNFQGVVTPQAEGNVRLAVDGGGTLISTGNSTTTGANYQIRVGNGTLIIGAGALTGRTGTAGIGHGYDLGADLNGAIVNATSSLLASNGVTVASSVFVATTGSSARVLGLSGTGQAEFSGSVDLSDAALTVTAGESGNALFSGTINNFTGSTVANNAVIKTGVGTVTLAGNNTFGGGTTLSQGTLRLDHVNAAGSGLITQTSSASTLEINTNGTIANNMSVFNVAFLQGAILSGNIAVNNATFDVVQNETSTISGIISGEAGVNKTGLGQLILTGANIYQGATTVNAGVLELASTSGAAAGATSSVSVADGATLLISQNNQVNNSATVTLSGGTIQRASGVSEVFGDLDLTAASFLDFLSGDTGTLSFGTYTPSSLLTVQNFLPGNKLTFGSDLTGSIGGALFSFDNDFTSSWDGSSTFTITAIPEPSNVVVALGLAGLLGWPMVRRRFGRPMM